MLKNNFLVAVFSLTLISLAVSFYFTRVNTSDLAKPKTTYAGITENYLDIFFTPRDLSARTGESIKVHPVISYKGQKNLDSIRLAINFNQEYLEFVDTDDQTLDPGYVNSNTAETESTDPGQLILTYKLAGNQEKKDNSHDFSTLNFRLKNDQKAENLLTFDLTNSEVVFNDQTRAFLSVNSKVVLNSPQ